MLAVYVKAGSNLDGVLPSNRDQARLLAETTDAQVVQVIGRKLVLYRQNKKKPMIPLK